MNFLIPHMFTKFIEVSYNLPTSDSPCDVEYSYPFTKMQDNRTSDDFGESELTITSVCTSDRPRRSRRSGKSSKRLLEMQRISRSDTSCIPAARRRYSEDDIHMLEQAYRTCEVTDISFLRDIAHQLTRSENGIRQWWYKRRNANRSLCKCIECNSP